MKRRFFVLIALAGLLSGGFVLLGELDARDVPKDVLERQVNANLLQVRIDGRWESFPLMPLAEHTCQNGDTHFKKYCP